MTTFEYTQRKKDYIDAQNPYKVIDKRDIRYVGNNIYELDGMEFEISPIVASSIDKFIGLQNKQVKAVADASGDDGVRDYRNYIAMINSIVKPEKMALVADPAVGKIVSATPLKKDAIPMEGFFDFAEMFCNDNNYTVGNITVASDISSGIEMFLIPDTKNITSLGRDEDFMTNGFIFRWNLGAIEAGNYYERLICSNGAVKRIYGEKAHINSLNEKDIRKMIALADNGYADAHFNSFIEKAYDSMETRASISELHYVHNLLLNNGVDEQTAKMVAPYQDDINAYNAAGYDTRHFAIAQAKSSIGAWDLFNRLTFFASHNEIWSGDDNRRFNLMSASVTFLRRPRDIKQYIDIFK